LTPTGAACRPCSRPRVNLYGRFKLDIDTYLDLATGHAG
jgi:hypothetical protein